MKYHFLVTAESSCDLSDADIESVRKTIADAVSNACDDVFYASGFSVRLVSNSEAMHVCGFNRRTHMLPSDEDCNSGESNKFVRVNIAAHTELGTNYYPAYVSVNRETDGTCSIVVRERGHDGNKQAVIDDMSRDEVRSLAHSILDGERDLYRTDRDALLDKIRALLANGP